MSHSHVFPVIYATPVCSIGKHQWRQIVYCDGAVFHYVHGKAYYLPRNLTAHEWRCGPDDHWHSYYDWPRYDPNDGMYAGLPRSLTKIYARHKEEIDRALEMQRGAS